MTGRLIFTELQELVRDKKWDELREVLVEVPAADIAEAMEEMLDRPGAEEGVLFRLLPRDRAAMVFSLLPPHRQRGLIFALSSDDAGAILNEMTPDDRTRLLETMPAEATKRLLDELSPEQLKQARALLGYPEGTAGRYMTPEYVALKPDLTARQALEQVHHTGRGKETLNILYIVDEQGKLVEELRLGSLVLADPEKRIADIEDRPLVSIPATALGEDVLAAFARYDRAALPVVDHEGKMLGILTHDDVLEFAERKATSEIQKLGGSEALDEPYLQTGFWPMVRKRGGWLSALFLGEMLTATAMGYFEREIERAAVVALFVPLIISSGGNSGSQATSLIIRSLALKEMRLRDWYKVFNKEIFSGLSLGFFLGFLGFLRILIWYWAGWHHYDGHPYYMGFTVWASLTGVVSFGSIAGAMLPFLLRKLGFDPATSSAPFVATLVDVTGLCIYFLMAMLILRTTLLKPKDAEAAKAPPPPTVTLLQPAGVVWRGVPVCSR